MYRPPSPLSRQLALAKLKLETSPIQNLFAKLLFISHFKFLQLYKVSTFLFLVSYKFFISFAFGYRSLGAIFNYFLIRKNGCSAKLFSAV